MLNLQRLAIFVAVVDAGSFTAAAVALGQTKAVVSFNVKQLEGELGVSLLVRSTRRLALTDAGERFYQRCLRLLQDAENLLDDVRRDHHGLSGVLRITTTRNTALRWWYRRWRHFPNCIRACAFSTFPLPIMPI